MVRQTSDGEQKHTWRFFDDGSAAGQWLNNLKNDDDIGQWWVDEGRLCTRWFRWEEGKAHCYDINRVGTNFVAVDSGGKLTGEFKLE